MDHYFEINCDGLIGPSHNYGGLAKGNFASNKNKQLTSYPKKAALEGLEKMNLCMDLGLKQIIFPPAPRPKLSALRNLGYKGSDVELLNTVSLEHLSSVYSASNMWTANAATVSSSQNTRDNKVHITPANLQSHFHRSLETPFTHALLKYIFRSDQFLVHEPLEASEMFSDEGAANTMQCVNKSNKVLEVFVFNYSEDDNIKLGRQSYLASQKIIENHKIRDSILVKQNPISVKEGVFHNDVIALNHLNKLIIHKYAYEKQNEVLNEIQDFFDGEVQINEISNSELSLNNAVKSYFFNSQLISNDSNDYYLILPEESYQINQSRELVNRIQSEWGNSLKIFYIPVRESMRNGGGPACLRLRLWVNESEYNSIFSGVKLNEDLYNELKTCIQKYYRDQLTPEDLRDPQLIIDCRKAYTEISKLLHCEELYLPY